MRLDKGILERYAPRIVHEGFLRMRVMKSGVKADAVGRNVRRFSPNFQSRKVGHGLWQAHIASHCSVDGARGSIGAELPRDEMPG